jgi:hypothetical protein
LSSLWGCIGTFWVLGGFSTIQTLLSLAIEDTPTATIEIIYPTETIGLEVITSTPEPTLNPIPFETVVRDSDLTSGDVGLIAGTLENPGVIVGFDNLRVSSPDS